MSAAPNQEKALEALSKKLGIILRRRKTAAEKLDEITEALDGAVRPWNEIGDDRMLSSMSNMAGAAAESLLKGECGNIARSRRPAADKIAAMEDLESLAGGLTWLGSCFRSSILVDMAFAKADARMNKNKSK